MTHQSLVLLVPQKGGMEITYYGHSSFKIKGKQGSVITDPFDPYIGFALPTVSADVVTVSHDHKDHNAAHLVKGTSRREKPFLIDKPGEYEVGGVSVFGVTTFHDANQGVERGRNIVYTIMIDEIRVCHLGDLGHELTQDQIAEIGSVDVVLCPVGGVYTINSDVAVKVITMLEPSIAVPMHFKTTHHDASVFGEMKTLEDFLKEYGVQPKPVPKLVIEKERLPEETEVVVITQQV